MLQCLLGALRLSFEQQKGGAECVQVQKARADVPLHSDELMYLLAGEFRIEPDGGTPVEVGPGDMAVLPSNTHVKITFKTRCKMLFVTAAPMATTRRPEPGEAPPTGSV
jgi:ethanolamine utilization protein EutQ (cupin superfamily)